MLLTLFELPEVSRSAHHSERCNEVDRVREATAIAGEELPAEPVRPAVADVVHDPATF